MQVNSNRDGRSRVRAASEESSGRRNSRLRESILGQLRQLGVNVDDDDLLSELESFDEDELFAILGLFGLLGFFALLGFLSKKENDPG